MKQHRPSDSKDGVKQCDTSTNIISEEIVTIKVHRKTKGD